MWLRKLAGRKDDYLLFGAPLPREVSDFVADLALNDIVEDDPFFDAWIRTGLLGPAMRRRDRAIADMWTLLLMEEPLRSQAVETLPYKDLLVAEVLLQEAEKQASQERGEKSERIARVASWITDQAYPEELKRSEGLRLRARCLVGNARRLLVDWEGAEGCFQKALSFLVDAPAFEQAFFYQMLAALREDQGRFEEALALLNRAVFLFGANEVGREASFCFARIGFIHLKKSDPGRAMKAFTAVRAQTASDVSLKILYAQVDLGRAACLAAAGLKDQAAVMLERGRTYRRGIRRHDQKIFLEWLDCRIAVQVGELETAIPRLEAVCRWLLGNRPYSEIFLGSLDLILAYSKKGWMWVHALSGVEDLARLAEVEEQSWALGALEKLREIMVLEQGDLESAIREARVSVPLSVAAEPELGLLLRRYDALSADSGERKSDRRGRGPGADQRAIEKMQRALLEAFGDEP